jgi:hypothetical protein
LNTLIRYVMPIAELRDRERRSEATTISSER